MLWLEGSNFAHRVRSISKTRLKIEFTLGKVQNGPLPSFVGQESYFLEANRSQIQSLGLGFASKKLSWPTDGKG